MARTVFVTGYMPSGKRPEVTGWGDVYSVTSVALIKITKEYLKAKVPGETDSLYMIEKVSVGPVRANMYILSKLE